MSLVNNLNEKIIVPLADRYMGTNIMHYLAEINKMSGWTPQQIRTWQNQKLQELINHAYYRTKYYKELFRKHNLKASDIRDVCDLSKIPALFKEQIYRKSEQFIPDNINKIRHRKATTGGSSGDPLKYLLDERSFSYATAVRYYYLTQLGYRPGDKLLVMGGRSVLPDHKESVKYKLYYFLNRKIFLSSINMSEKVIDHYIKIIRDKKIKYIYGSPSALYLMACRLEKCHKNLTGINAIVSTSEMMLDQYREKIESVFQCRVMDVYGAGDGGLSTYESAPRMYHVGYNCLVEVDASGRNNSTGDILVTDLLNYAFPFIRYRIGDHVTLLKADRAQKYYNGQIITSVLGRISDIMKLENGITLTGKGIPTLFSKLNVRAYRVKKIGHLHIECEIQKADKFSLSDESLISAAFRKHAGEDCKLTITYTNRFEPLPNGKTNFFISDTD